jgi:hypothetical protein
MNLLFSRPAKTNRVEDGINGRFKFLFPARMPIERLWEGLHVLKKPYRFCVLDYSPLPRPNQNPVTWWFERNRRVIVASTE